MTRQLTASLFACALALMLTANSRAGTIIGVATVTGGGNAVINPIVTNAENNDDQSDPISNIAVISKLFNANEPIDIVFEVLNTTGVTEYYIAEGMANLSGVSFIGYSFELGFGTGANFVRSAADDGLDFDTPDRSPGPTSGRFNFTTTAHMQDMLRFSMGLVPHGMTDAFTLSIDVPDFNAAAMPASASTANGFRFTLRQTPVIPEPGTLGIALLSLLMATVYTLRRRWG